MSLTDAGVISWDSKFDFQQLRPEQTINGIEQTNNGEDTIRGISEDDIDGNPTSKQDPDWDPLIPSPAFPDYTSGHSSFGGGAAEVFSSFFGTDEFSFEVASQEIPGYARSYESFSEISTENSESRLFGGVNIRSSSMEGEASGADVGEYVVDNALAPVSV
ncbi:MAG: hypothetical protein BRC47_04835 [Cyanobacteria bacterium QS_7_48_42]|jgi:hypothetical protein|nr:MAG: hypothetical protein BRC47_04835 [Cyanobacteria bacterium QS_7_48_42]PSP12394.1 MAG: hypothetical protein BRC49_05245 [Cyanobacteria bacterium SW_10_48_33]PSP23942.1 MAG: hypothetical protein BRC52_01185 [Cyanobacteria bacterium SW_5_48_44]PSP30190.1 MAG: hypothetical protein BRC59_04785 [Cyanobacteria bacterium SW_4_48_29]